MGWVNATNSLTGSYSEEIPQKREKCVRNVHFSFNLPPKICCSAFYRLRHRSRSDDDVP
jgi:hypothetical protein